MGGFDGKAAMGFGIMYCVNKKWWDAWESYVEWSYKGDSTKQQSLIRPQQLTTECLIDRDPESYIRGIFGSYEVVKQDLKCLLA